MRRRVFMSGLAVSFAGLSVPAAAQTAADRIVAQLRGQGFDRIRVKRTLLGRVRILARGEDMRREIVLDPSTGAILRDYWTERGDDDDDDDDDEDDHDRRRGRGLLLDSDDGDRREDDDD